MKRRIAAVLMADVAGMSRAPAGDEAAARRLDEHRTVIRDVVARGGGVMMPAPGEVLVAAFPSAVGAVRSAVDMQETLRARNKGQPPGERRDFKLGLTIAEVPDGEGEVPDETLAAAARLVALAAPGGMCISQSVREAVAGKLNVKFQDVPLDGEGADAEPSTYRVAISRRAKAPEPRTSAGVAAGLGKPLVAGAAALLALAAVALVALPRRDAAPPPRAEPQAAAPAAPAPDAKPKAPGGTLVFKPALAPDPTTVLTARRLLPNAWKDCHGGKPDVALKGCKTLLDSGIAKGDELADIHVSNAKALRDRREPDKALESLNAALALSRTPAAFGLRGTLHYEKGRWDEAIADYTEAIRLDSANGEAFNNRAWTYYRAGRTAEALADADAAVRLLAKEAYVWDTRAHIHAELGNREAAIRDFRAALAIDPKHAEAKAGLARLGVN